MRIPPHGLEFGGRRTEDRQIPDLEVEASSLYNNGLSVVPNLADEADLASIHQIGRQLIRLLSLVHTMQNLEVLNVRNNG